MISLNVRMKNENSSVVASYKEAMSGPARAAWQSAIEEEISRIQYNDT